MERYFFHVSNGQNLPDESGMSFPGVQEARKDQRDGKCPPTRSAFIGACGFSSTRAYCSKRPG